MAATLSAAASSASAAGTRPGAAASSTATAASHASPRVSLKRCRFSPALSRLALSRNSPPHAASFCRIPTSVSFTVVAAGGGCSPRSAAPAPLPTAAADRPGRGRLAGCTHPERGADQPALRRPEERVGVRVRVRVRVLMPGHVPGQGVRHGITRTGTTPVRLNGIRGGFPLCLALWHPLRPWRTSPSNARLRSLPSSSCRRC